MEVSSHVNTTKQQLDNLEQYSRRHLFGDWWHDSAVKANEKVEDVEDKIKEILLW